jgi:hypothetical protein
LLQMHELRQHEWLQLIVRQRGAAPFLQGFVRTGSNEESHEYLN